MSNLNRRQALQQMGFAGAGAVIAGAISSCTPSMAAKPNLDADVLNFALNLE
ncbi:ferritin-like domain-containing protein, partial [Klebsiella pneumoniae]|nr:ferritin-like domain-containing protein [Klebsiella pneumoniae]